MRKGGISILKLQPKTTVCSIQACTREAVRQVTFVGEYANMVIPLCLAHLRELRDVVAERIG